MRRTASLSLLFIGSLLASGPASMAFGQAPSGTSPNPSAAPSAQSPTSPDTSDRVDTRVSVGKVDDKRFVKDAAVGGMLEIELGKLAAQKSSRDDVKKFAQKIVDDHTKSGDQLKQIAAKQNIEIATSLDAKHQARVDKLSKLSGDDFDKAYVKDQVKDHQSDIKDFSAEAQSGTDPAVKAFASSTLPTLQEHLEAAKSLNKSEKEGAKTKTSN